MRILLLSFFVVIVDQITKFLIRLSFEYGKPQNIVGDWVRLTYIENPGMAFGIQVGGQTFFTIFAILATIVIFVYILRARQERWLLRVALALILGGAIGNLIDRFLYGKVVDFIDVGIGETRWPIFNVADSAVTIGMIILVILVIFDRNTQEVDEPKQELTAKRQIL